MVTWPCWPAGVPPNAVRADRWLLRPAATHSGHWCPTVASCMQDGQIGRLHRLQRR
jgi:hypothetical protein